METEEIPVINKSGVEITLSFNAANLIQDDKGIGLRIPVQIRGFSRVIVILAFKVSYPTAELFLASVEQFGKQQVAQWLQSSSEESVVSLPPDIKHAWSISFEQS